MENNNEINTSAEGVVADNDLPIEKPKGLSLRDALEVAIVATEDKKENERVRTGNASSSDSSEQGGAKEEVVSARDTEAKVPSEEPKYEPPAEYTAEEKRYFSELSRKAQEAQLRLDKSRKAKIEEIKSAQREYDYVKRLAESVNPYIKARGLKESPEVALTKAVEMWREFEEGDPKRAAAEYLRAKGIEPPKELLEEIQANPYQEQLAPLQNKLNQIEQRIAQEDYARAGQSLTQAWSAFAEQKNAAGGPRFPDIVSNDEAGLRRASEIGSLVSGSPELLPCGITSRQFIANVQARIPDASYLDLMAEAYKFVGGRVDESNTSKSQTSQEHLVKSNRAASSVPGRSASVNGSVGVKKYKTYREAAAAALEQLKSD